MSKAHPGFAAEVKKIEKKDGVSEKVAAEILAKASRGASAGAKRKNPNLKHVK